MQTTEIKRRQQFTEQERVSLLDELSMSNMTISRFAELKEIHPVTIHQWKRNMSSSQKKELNQQKTFKKLSLKMKG